MKNNLTVEMITVHGKVWCLSPAYDVCRDQNAEDYRNGAYISNSPMISPISALLFTKLKDGEIPF